jgi:histidinol-phosphatase
VWATLIALTHIERGPVLGVVSSPALHRRWWAADGLGAFADGRQCTVSDVSDIADAQVCVTFSPEWDQIGLTNELVAILQQARRARGFGDFWQHCLVAEGAVDLAIDARGVMPYDLAAVKVIVEEAGGRFTDRFGEATHEHDTAISSNGLLHDQVIGRLAR